MTVLSLAAGFRPRRFSGGGDRRFSIAHSSFRGNQAFERGRGRFARTPSEIPPRGWKDVLLRVYSNISDHRIVALAAGVTFYALLAIFPAIAALVSIYGLFADPAKMSSHFDSLSGILPGGAVDVMREQLTRLTSQPSGTLGLTFLVGLAVSLWSANAGLKSLFDTLNVIYSEKEKRGLIAFNAVSLAFTSATIVFSILAIGAVVVLPNVLGLLGLSSTVEILTRIGKWPVLLVLVTLGLAFVYRYGPSRDKARWGWITWGSAFAAIAWLIVSLLFSWYAANFGKFNETYGSLGAVIGFMMWMWLSTIVILIGAELDAEMEHQTMHDTTEGPPEPMGERGATMADTLGAAQG